MLAWFSSPYLSDHFEVPCHDDSGSCMNIWWGERLSDRCDWPGSWGMELHSIRLQERYSYSKHPPSTLLSSGEATKNGPSKSWPQVAGALVLGILQRQCPSQQARQLGGVAGLCCGSVCRRSASRHRREDSADVLQAKSEGVHFEHMRCAPKKKRKPRSRVFL